ncbi:MAG: methyltransferase [Opitutus sp.]
MGHDRYYTPEEVAERLVDAVQCRHVRRVADFAAGIGELLRIASKRWPNAAYAGIDIDEPALVELRRMNNRWKSCRTNFLNLRRTEKCFEECGLSIFDVVLLNPPFSARRVKTVTVEVTSGAKILCGRAIAFVLRSLRYCRTGGQILAILPSGSRSSVRDSAAWAYLGRVCEIEPLFKLDDETFVGCSASAEAVRFTIKRRYAVLTNPIQQALVPLLNPDISIIRGRLPMHTSRLVGQVAVIHTTDLADHKVTKPVNFATKGLLLADQLHVFIPRVGRPQRDKICSARLSNVCLSDCVIAIRGRTDGMTQAVRREILQHWDEFAELYRGTGAPYVGVVQIGRFLAARGFSWDCESKQIKRTDILFAQPEHVSSLRVASAS